MRLRLSLYLLSVCLLRVTPLSVSLCLCRTVFTLCTLIIVINRDHPAIRSRNFGLLLNAIGGFFVLACVLFTIYSYGARSSCVLVLIVSTYGSAWACIAIAVRGLHLLFLYKWSEARLKVSLGQKESADW